MPEKRIIPRVCLLCGADFLADAWKIKSGRAKFCSQACGYAARNTLPPATCATCGKPMDPGKPGRPRQFCNRACRWRDVRPLADRFWEKVDKNGDSPNPFKYPGLGQCWAWKGATRTLGYGAIGQGRRGSGAPAGAHCVSWEIHNGPIPKGIKVRHRCDNPPCTNPDHLVLGTVQDNSDDMVIRGRSQTGERHHAAKLSEEDVREIRRRYARGESGMALAAEFGVHQMTIYPIVSFKTWRHVV